MIELNLSWWSLLMLAAVYLLLAQPAAIPVASAAARRYRSGPLRHRVWAGTGGWVAGLLLVTVAWYVMLESFNIDPFYDFPLAYPPAWLLAWALRRASGPAEAAAPPFHSGQ